MTQIILSDDQLRAIRQASGTVEIRDQNGILVGYVAPPAIATEDEIAEARRRLKSNGPWHTTAEVLGRVRALEQK